MKYLREICFFLFMSMCLVGYAQKDSIDTDVLSDDLLCVSRSDVWNALSILSPEFQLLDRQSSASTMNYVPSAASVMGVSRWATGVKTQNVEFMVDGQRVSADMLRGMSMYNIKSIKLHRDALSLSRWGLHGADGVVEITTRKHEKGSINVNYRTDLSLNWADKTAFRHRHQLDFEGGDKYVGYHLTALLSPSSKGIKEGSKSDILGLRAMVEYNRKALNISNDITFRNVNEHLPNVTEYAAGSFDKTKYTTLTDRFSARLQISPKLWADGHFSFARMLSRRDIYVSPSSEVFANNADVRANGTYHILRHDITSFQGDFSLNYTHQFDNNALLKASAGMKIYSGTNWGEGYGGRGIISDQMGYVTFTQAYDSLQKPTAYRNHENELQEFVDVAYHHDRLGLEFTTNINHSSLLPKNNRTVVYGGAKCYFDMIEENDAPVFGLNKLRLTASFGTTGIVPFSDSYWRANYRNDVMNEYIYNYYQLGASLQGIANESLNPTKMRTAICSVDMATNSLELHADVYYKRTSNMLIFSALPLVYGYTEMPDNGGQLCNKGFNIKATQKIMDKELKLNGTLALNYNRNKVTEIPEYFLTHFYAVDESLQTHLNQRVFSGSMLFNARWNSLTGAVALYSTKGFHRLTTMQLGYQWNHLKGSVKTADITLTAENWKWQNSIVASLHLHF